MLIKPLVVITGASKGIGNALAVAIESYLRIPSSKIQSSFCLGGESVKLF